MGLGATRDVPSSLHSLSTVWIIGCEMGRSQVFGIPYTFATLSRLYNISAFCRGGFQTFFSASFLDMWHLIPAHQKEYIYSNY